MRQAAKQVLDFPSAMRWLSNLTQRMQFAQFAGITFKGARDLYTALGYPRTLSTRDYRDRYKRGDIAARIIEAFPDATWGGGAEIVEDEDPDTLTALEEEFEALNDRLHVWSVLHRADILCGLGEFAVILIGAPGKLEEELPAMQSQEDVLYLLPYAPDEAQIDLFEENVEDPRYGLPKMYTIQRRTISTQQKTTASFSRKVHWTRVIHVADTLLEDRVFGIPRLEKVWNRLDDLEKVVGGGSEAFWLRVNQGHHWDVSPDVKLDDGVIEKLKEEAEEFAHQMRRTMATRGMKVTALGSDVAPFENPVRALISLISGATKIPQRILLGSERGELASTQDRENWNDRIGVRRTSFGDPLVRTLVTRLMESGALPEAEEYNVRWPEIKALTMTEQADVASKWASLPPKVVLPEEIRDIVLGLDKLEEEQVAEIDTKEQEKAEQDLEKEKLKAQQPQNGFPPGKGGFPPKKDEEDEDPKEKLKAASEGPEESLTDEMVEKMLRYAGGPGSGNFGHSGRPGEIGGSGGGEGGGESKSKIDRTSSHLSKVTKDIEAKLGKKIFDEATDPQGIYLGSSSQEQKDRFRTANALDKAVAEGKITQEDRDAYVKAHNAHEQARIEDDQQYYDKSRVDTANSWKSSSTSFGATAMKEAIHAKFGGEAIVHNPSGHKIDDLNRGHSDALMTRMYRESQQDVFEQFKKGVPVPEEGWDGNKFTLHRGMKGDVQMRGVLESWTPVKAIAQKFAKGGTKEQRGRTRKKTFNRNQVLTFHKSRTWRGEGAMQYQEKEYIIIRGLKK